MFSEFSSRNLLSQALGIMVCCSIIFPTMLECRTSSDDKFTSRMVSTTTTRSGNCQTALDDCFKQYKCRVVLSKLLHTTCKDLFSNSNYVSSESSKITCTKQCRRKLKRAKRGPLKLLLTCKTNNSEYFPYQDRADRCLAGKIKTVVHDNYEDNGCSRIFDKCTRYNGCRRRYDMMMHECADMVYGMSCSKTCERSLRRFLVSKHTRGFYTCKCDGAFYFQKTCHSLKQNIKKLCVSRQFKQFLHKRRTVVHVT